MRFLIRMDSVRFLGGFRGSGEGVTSPTTPVPVAMHASFGVRNVRRSSNGIKGAVVVLLLFTILYC